MTTLLWCPVDLPKCPRIPKLTPNINWKFWEFAKLTINKDNPYHATDFTDECKKNYPDLVNWFNLFPYKTIRNIKFNHQLSAVIPHIDFTKPELEPELHYNNKINEPCGYRVFLTGTRKGKLYIVHNGEKIYCNMPEDTDVYVLGHTSTLHGVDDDNDRWTFFTHFEIDDQKHKILLDRSLQKYKDYAIVV